MGKRFFIVAMVVTVLCLTIFQLSVFAKVSMEPNYVVLGPTGDFNQDGGVTAVDALHVLQVASGRLGQVATPQILSDCDMNQDGKITAVDSLIILQMVLLPHIA